MNWCFIRTIFHYHPCTRKLHSFESSTYFQPITTSNLEAIFQQHEFRRVSSHQSPARSGSKKGRSLERPSSLWRRKRDSGFACGEGRPLPNTSSVGRIPKNVPLACFLNGIPPHRFEPLFPKAKTTGRPWKDSERGIGGADRRGGGPSVCPYAQSPTSEAASA